MENKILHEIFRVVSRFPRYISCYCTSRKVDYLRDSAWQILQFRHTVFCFFPTVLFPSGNPAHATTLLGKILEKFKQFFSWFLSISAMSGIQIHSDSASSMFADPGFFSYSRLAMAFTVLEIAVFGIRIRIGSVVDGLLDSDTYSDYLDPGTLHNMVTVECLAFSLIKSGLTKLWEISRFLKSFFSRWIQFLFEFDWNSTK